MSYKLSALQYATVPAVASDFQVVVEGLSIVSILRAEAADVIIPETITNQMSYCGVPLILPTAKQKQSGTMTVTFQEDWGYSTLRCLRAMYPTFRMLGRHGDPELHDVTVSLTPRFGPGELTNLATSFIPVNLSSSVTSLSSFTSGSIGITYKNCSLVKIDQLSVGWDKAGEVIRWKCTFSYNDIKFSDPRSNLSALLLKKLGKKVNMSIAEATAILVPTEYLALAELNSRGGTAGRIINNIVSL